MKAYSVDFREKIVNAISAGDSSVRKVAQRFEVSKNFVQKLVTQKRTKGHILPGKQGGSMVSPVMKYKAQLIAIVEKYNDATLAEYCELLYEETGLWVSLSTMCRTFQRLELPLKKKRSAPVVPKATCFAAPCGIEFTYKEQSIGKK